MKTFQHKGWSEDMLASKAEAITAEFECELVTPLKRLKPQKTNTPSKSTPISGSTQ